jgi:hypothetical protein
MEQKFLTQEEISSLQDLRMRQSSLINSLGQVEYQIFLLELNKKNLRDDIQKLENDNENLGKSLTEKYGNGSIDLETGEITAV